MSERSGLSSQLGLGTETTWGTAVTPTTFLPYLSEGIEYQQSYIRSPALEAGVVSLLGDLHVATTHAITGPVNLDVTRSGFGKLLNMLHGNSVSPSTPGGATNARLQTHDIGTSTPYGKGLTVQVARPDVGGTVRPFTFSGCKVASVTFTCAKSGVLTSTWNLVGKDETTATALASASYAATPQLKPFNFVQGSVEFDDVVLTDVVNEASITITLPMATERYSIGSSVVSEPINNDLVSITASLGLEFASLTQHSAFTAATRRKFELNFNTADFIEGSTPYSLLFSMPQTVTTNANAVVQGPDILTQTVELECTYNGSAAPLTISYENKDTSL
jgi:hypothetical protein